MSEESTRIQLENRIIAASHKITSHIDPDNPLWILEDDIQEFKDEWRNLVEHYQWTTDAEIGVLVVREYVQLLRLFRNVISDRTDPSSDVVIPIEAKAKAKEYIAYLEHFMDEIIKEVERTTNNQTS